MIKKLYISLIALISLNAHAEISLERVGRLLPNQNVKSPDIYEKDINSPKSVSYSVDGNKIYINSLEGNKTVVYDSKTLTHLKTISYDFSKDNNHLFINNEDTVFGYPYKNGQKGSYNNFSGKPVEMAFSHNGKYLWVPFYRRSFDNNAVSPSAIAIIDTDNDEIVRVMPTGPLPKYVLSSPDSKKLAVVHWGDNTVGLIDISSNNPKDFKYEKHLIVGQKLNLNNVGSDRDHNCGYCLRGSIFSPDSKYLLVARMGGNGLAGFNVETGEYLGVVLNVVGNPRHIVLSKDKDTIYVSGNTSGQVGKYSLKDIIETLNSANKKEVNLKSTKSLNVGSGARTIALSPDEDYLYVAVNNDPKLVAVNLDKWQVEKSVKVDPYTVGLAVSKDGNTIVTTSQGKNGNGGNSVGFYKK